MNSMSWMLITQNRVYIDSLTNLLKLSKQHRNSVLTHYLFYDL